MKKNVVKMLSALLIAILIVGMSISTVNAINFNGYGPDAYSSVGDSTGTAETAQSIMGVLMTVAQVIGVGVGIIMLIVLAIKYMSAAPGDKAEIKKHAVVYVVGAVVLFAASGILGIIQKFADVVKPSK